MASASLLTTALISGMVAAFNPCGFAMLPAYLAYFISGSDGHDTSRAHSIFRAIIVGLVMSASFVLLFGLFGVLSSTLISQGTIEEQVQWVTLILGILMVPLGIWLLTGRELYLKIPRLNRGGRSTGLFSIFIFGISFAVVSLGCTAPVFFANVVGSFSSDGWFEGTQVFITYGLGMSLIVMSLTLATGLARTEMAQLMRRILPHIGKISGAIVILVGIFLAIYGWWEIQVQRGNFDTNWLVDTSTEFQTSISNWIGDVGATRLAVVLGLWILGLVIWAVTSKSDENQFDITTSGGSMSEEIQVGETMPNGQAAMAEERTSLKHLKASGIRDFSDFITLRRVLLAILGLTYFLLELLRYDWELMLLPIYRTVIDLPDRIWGWISDPFRWSVPFEIAFTAFVIAIVILRQRNRARRRTEKETSPLGAK